MDFKDLYKQHLPHTYVNEDRSSFDSFSPFEDNSFFIDTPKKKKHKKRKKKEIKKLLKYMKKEGYVFSNSKKKKHKKNKKKKASQKQSSDVLSNLLLSCVPKLIEVGGECVKEHVKNGKR